MRVIGLTGGIGTGKSTVARILSDLGAVIIDADKVGHEVLRPESPAWREVVDAFGPHVLGPGGEIDRARLAQAVFSDPENRLRLNRITHPAIYQLVKARLTGLRRQGVDLAVLEAPLLVEADWFDLVDEVWVTVAPRETVLRRLRERSGMAEAAALARIASQLPEAERVRHADIVISTDCPLDELRERTKTRLAEFKARHPQQPRAGV